MSDASSLAADIRTLTALLKESQQQSQQRHQDYLDGRQEIQLLRSQLKALESGGATPQTPRTDPNAAGQKSGPHSSSRKAPPQNPQPTSSRTQSKASIPTKPAAPKPAAGPSARPAAGPSARPAAGPSARPAAGPSARPAQPQQNRTGHAQVLDSDGNEGLPEGWEAKNRKRGIRPQAVKERQALVREIIQRFLQFKTEPRPDDRDGKIYSDFPPSPATLHPLPDTLAEASSIDWDSNLGSAYNHRVVVMLVAEIRKRNRTGFYYTTPELSEAVKEHLRYLRDVRKALFFPIAPEVEAEQRLYRSANTRKNSLSASRLTFIYRFRLAQYFHVSPEMLEVLLGVDCTSEDELDKSCDSPTYLIRRLRWRNAKLTAFLRLVDKCMELRSRRKGGSNTRNRLPSLANDSDAGPPEGFPENWFDMDYLSDLDQWDRQALLIGPEVTVNWEELHSALKAIVRRERGQLKKQRPSGPTTT